MSYVPGRVWACCDRCGFNYPLSQLRREHTGLMVCPDDFDPRPAQMSAPNIKAEGLPKPNARPDNQVDNTPNETTREDL